MILLLKLITALAGVLLLFFGLGFGAVFWMARSVFDRSLKGEVANSGRAYVEMAVERIRNPWVRRLVNQHVGSAVGAAAVSIVRGAITTRIRLGFWLAIGGVALTAGAFYLDALVSQFATGIPK